MNYYQQIVKQVDELLATKLNINLNQAVKRAFTAYIAYKIVQKLYVAYFGVLSRLPGPQFTRFITYPRFLLDSPRGTVFLKLKKLHEVYGDVVRFGPTAISISDKDLIRQVMITDDLPKGPVYKAFQRNGQPTLFSATDKAWHKNRRRIVSPAFSIKSINLLEPFMENCIDVLMEKIDQEITLTQDSQGYGTIDVWSLIQRLALDVIGETAFGTTFDMVKNNQHFIPDAIVQAMRNSTIRALFPFLSTLLLINAENPEPKIKKFIQTVIHERLTNNSKERKDILQFLINSHKSKDKDDQLTSDAIIEETILFLIAGSETTSNTIGFAFYELLRNSDKLEKLYQEIDQLDKFDHEQLKHLTYLNAVINETLRLDPVAAGPLNRVTNKPIVLGDLVLPEKTNVLLNLYRLQTHEKYWSNPFEFIPERWIENSQNDDLEAYLPFSIGTRNCIGKNFALQEMRISIATILKYYDIQPIPIEMEEAKQRRLQITQSVAKGSFCIKIKRRS